MKYPLLLALTFTVMSASTAFGQVLIDKSINLTGSPANSRVMGIKEVSDAQDAVSAEALQKGGLIYAAVTGGPNTYTLALTPAVSAPYNEGMVILFKATGDNTAAVTLNGIPLRKDVSSPLAAGDIQNDQIVTVVYDGANFQLASRTADSNSGGSVTSVSTAAANNGVSASWANPTTTPALTIGLGNITPSSVAATGTVTGSNLSGTHTGNSSGTNTGDQTLSGLGGVPTTRTISTTAPLTGGGDLSADRTFAITQATTSTNGYLSSSDWNTFNSKESALTFSNGLTRTSNAISWGGSLTGNTTIAQTDKTLAFTGTAANAFSVDGTTFSVDAANDGVGIGTTSNSASAKLDVVNTSGLGRIRVSGVQTGYTQADVLLQTGTTHGPEGRGTGIYTQNQGNNTTWYFGNPYSSPDMFVINRKAGTGLLVETAQNNASGVSNMLSITSAGNVGIGTSSSGNKLNVVNSTLNGGTAGIVAINSTYTLDQPPADIRAAIAGTGHFTTTANVRSAGIYGWVPTGGHGTLASAAIFDRPDNNRRIFIGGSQTSINTPSLHVYNTSTTGTDFIIDNTGKVGIGTVSPSTSLHVNGTATATALAGAFDQSASGYVRIGNMQMAWGTATLASGQTWTAGSGSTRYVLCGQNITFPASFLSAPTVTFGMIDGIIAGRSAYVSYFTPSTTNVNTIYLTSPIAHFDTGGVTVHWTAVGRWQ